MELVAAILSFLVHLWPMIALLALALLLIRPLARIVAFAGGLIFCVAGVFLSPATGPDNPLLIVPLFGLPFLLAAACAEGVLRLCGWRGGSSRARREIHAPQVAKFVSSSRRARTCSPRRGRP